MPISSNGLRLRKTSHPILYEVNVRVLLNELSTKAGKAITLDRIPNSLLDEWAELGFSAIWLMGVWTTGDIGVQEAKNHVGLRESYAKALPDYTDDDIISSPYAVKSYTISRSLGGVKAFETLRSKLAERGVGIVLDFVCNHTARDHKWVSTHPEYFISGKDGDEKEKPDHFFRTETKNGERTLAFGRDPYFPGWTDTAQLNPLLPEARAAMIESLNEIAELCDGVRCDMAMLILNEVFQKTWAEQLKSLAGQREQTEFWKDAVEAVRKNHPDFLFLAEAYWNLEWPLQQLGFDYTYDKSLYDRLMREGAASVVDHLKAEATYQKHSIRFIENHDEPRIAQILPSESWQFAAATVVATIPGMLLLHEGQLDGWKIKHPVQLARRAQEESSAATRALYTKLLKCLDDGVIKSGEWKLLSVRSAWHDNHTSQNIIAYSWRKNSTMRLVVVNYAPYNSQGYVELSLAQLDGASFEFRDLLGSAVYVRDRIGLQNKGMYFDLPRYGIHFFDVRKAK